MSPTPDPGPGPGPVHLPAVILPSQAAVPAMLPAPAPLANRPDPIALLKALRRRWPLAVSVGLLLAAVVAGATYLLVPSAKYTARALLHVNSVPPRILLPIREVNSDFGAYQRTQLSLIKSRLVLNAALKRGGIAELKVIAGQADPVEYLEKGLQADFANGSEVLRVSMSGDAPEEPMKLVNAVVLAYLDEVVDVETRQRRERYDLLKATWDRYQENLREKRKELKRLTEMAGSDDKRTLANLQQLEIERLGRAEDELSRVRTELRKLQVEAAILQEEGALASNSVSRAQIEEEISKDQAIEQLAARAVQVQGIVDRNSRQVRSPSDPSIQRYRSELQAIQASLAGQRKRLYPIIARQLQEKQRGNLDARTALLQERIRLESGIEKVLADDVKRLSERSHSILRSSVDLFSIQEEIAAADEIAKTIRAEVEALNLELQAPPRVRLIEKAVLPRTKDERRPLRMAGMAGCGTLALVLVGISFWEFRARRVDSADAVIHHLGMRLVGIMPALPRRQRSRSTVGARGGRWQNLLIESVDAARTSLLHASRTESVRVVMVASALSGEGKTSLSCHLATSLARAGRRTLLIDGDLRRPSVHELFELPPVPGLSEVLRGEVEIPDAIRPTMANGLWLIPAGSSDGEAIQGLACRDLGALFEQLKQRFDFIVIDSSPVLPVADALLIGQHVDAVLFSIMRDVSRIPKVQAAYERMSALGIRMLGAIVTGERVDSYGSEYQYPVRSRNPS